MMETESTCSAETFASWASNVTKCTNPTFSRVVNRLWSDPSLQKEVMSVLAAVTRIIQEKGGTESSTEYYAVLLSILNTDTAFKQAEAYLLRLLMTKALPTALLRSTCAEASKTIVNVLEFALKSEEPNVALVKSLIYCLGSLLRAQSVDAWSTESVRHLFRILLRFTCHEKPAWRKACHESILSIINADLKTNLVSTHPASHQAAEFILNITSEEHNSLCSFVKIRDADCTRLLQALHLLSNVAISLTKADLKKCCEVLLELTRFPNPSVAEKCFESIGKIFENHPSNNSMPQELAGRLVTALYSSKPPEPTVLEIGSTNLLQAWFCCIFYACSHLSYSAKISKKEDEKLIANQHLDRFSRILFEGIISSSLAKMRQFCAVLLDRCLTDVLYSHIEELEFMKDCPQLLPYLAQQFRESLVLRYRESWLLTIPIFARLCRIWPRVEGAELPAPLAENLKNIAQLRDSLADGSCPLLDSHSSTEAKNALVDEFDRACISAINTWGPELILTDVISIEPLLAELEESKSLHLLRSWILPLVMRSVPQNSCDISFFTDYLLSLADRAVAVTRKMASGQGFISKLPTAPTRSAIIKSAITLVVQLWCCLPTFLHKAPKSWDPIAKTLGNRLAEEVINTPLLREAILKSLRALCEVAADDEAGLKVMRGGARIIIPRLLTIYEECDPESHADLKQKIRSTLLAYFSILPAKIVNNPCEIAIKKYEETEKLCFLELISMMTPYLSKDAILKVMKKIGPLLNNPSPMLCKRAYKILEEICAVKTEQSREYVEENFREMIQLLSSDNCLISNLAQLNMSGKKQEFAQNNSLKLAKLPWKSRLRILKYLLRELVLDIQKTVTEEKDLENHQHVQSFIDLFLDETLLAFRKHGKIVQNEAANLLCDYVFALSGLLSPREQAKQRELMLESKSMASMVTGMDEEQEEDNASVSSFNSNHQFHSFLKVTEQYKLCRSLLDFLPRLLSRLPPANPLMQTPNKTKTKLPESHWERLVVTAGQGLCRLLNHMQIKSMLLSILSEPQTEENASFKQRISGFLGQLILVAESCVKVNKKAIAEQGLDIVKSLVAYAGRWIYVSEITSPIVKVNPLIKTSMRNTVRKIMEKLVKKVGATSLKPLMAIEYHKMINNINKEMMRTQRKKNSKGGECKNQERDDEEEEEDIQFDEAASKKSKASVISEMSHISLPKRVHMLRMDELLSAGQEKLHDSEKRSIKPTLAEKTMEKFAQGHKSLVEDIEVARAEDGLSRKSKQRMRLGLKGEEHMSSSDEDDAMSEDEESSARRPLQRAGNKRSKTSLYLVEDASEDILDLADPSSLALATTKATSEKAARKLALGKKTVAAIASHRDFDSIPAELIAKIDPVEQARLRKLKALSDLPSVKGKIVISGSQQAKKARLENMDDYSSDDGQSSDEEALDSKYKQLAGGRGLRRKLVVKGKKQKRLPGHEYKSASARGDMSKPGKPDPYAFVPLGAALCDGPGATKADRLRLLRGIGIGSRKRRGEKSSKPSKQLGVTNSRRGKPRF